jgi:hypothetical protein
MAETIKTNRSMTKVLRKIPVLRSWMGRRAVTRELEKLKTLYGPLIEKARKDRNEAEVGSLEAEWNMERQLVLGPVYADAAEKLVAKARRFGIAAPSRYHEGDDWESYGARGLLDSEK